ncbi:hypothetical protein OIE71_04595 [Streptomyces sp. NBC_01725]|uniref:hypothetical protein n=1 Tax=Streptomyces sp. NBC_01725 TaxID=2975923 RepID=UPI002E27E8DB|nr:hypothetical protein [Streptomyces sp. NBC_01725]
MTYPRTERSSIPDAVAAVVAAVVHDFPAASPDAIGRLTVNALKREGWHWHLGHEPLCAPVRARRAPPGVITRTGPFPPATH